MARIQRPNFRGRQGCDLNMAMFELSHSIGCAVQLRIMNHDGDIISSMAVVQFHQVSAGVQSQLEGRQGVFRRELGKTSMRNDEGFPAGDESRPDEPLRNIHVYVFAWPVYSRTNPNEKSGTI